ncbi:MAG: carbon-nitrogen hydrolase family protein [Solirubrobacterales bacterium]
MPTQSTIRAAAVQLEARLGDIDWNLEECARLAGRAAAEGAEWIVLPEFFTTGVAFRPDLEECALPPDGAATQLLRGLAREHGCHVGGSFLVHDADGHVRNAFTLADPTGAIVGRHDKDLPTMWENALYIGGGDPGRIDAGGCCVGVALCWELMRTETVKRLRGRVDLVLGGSGWWSIPIVPPRRLTARLEARNRGRAERAPARFARCVGAPVVHAAHSGSFDGLWPGLPAVYRGHYEGGASISDGDGRTLAFRGRDQGPGVAVGEVTPVRGAGIEPPERFWLQRRGAVAALAWAYQNPLGRRRYHRSHAARHLLERPDAERR